MPPTSASHVEWKCLKCGRYVFQQEFCPVCKTKTAVYCPICDTLTPINLPVCFRCDVDKIEACQRQKENEIAELKKHKERLKGEIEALQMDLTFPAILSHSLTSKGPCLTNAISLFFGLIAIGTLMGMAVSMNSARPGLMADAMSQLILMLVLMLAFGRIPAGIKYAGDKRAALDTVQQALDDLPEKIKEIKGMTVVKWCEKAHEDKKKRSQVVLPHSDDEYEGSSSEYDGKDWEAGEAAEKDYLNRVREWERKWDEEAREKELVRQEEEDAYEDRLQEEQKQREWDDYQEEQARKEEEAARYDEDDW